MIRTTALTQASASLLRSPPASPCLAGGVCANPAAAVAGSRPRDGMPYYRCNACVVVTNSRFISAAIKAAALPFCTLVERMELARWLAEVKTVIATAGR